MQQIYSIATAPCLSPFILASSCQFLWCLYIHSPELSLFLQKLNSVMDGGCEFSQKMKWGILCNKRQTEHPYVVSNKTENQLGSVYVCSAPKEIKHFHKKSKTMKVSHSWRTDGKWKFQMKYYYASWHRV